MATTYPNWIVSGLQLLTAISSHGPLLSYSMGRQDIKTGQQNNVEIACSKKRPQLSWYYPFSITTSPLMTFTLIQAESRKSKEGMDFAKHNLIL